MGSSKYSLIITQFGLFVKPIKQSLFAVIKYAKGEGENVPKKK